jgi:hypothetical protein
LFGGREREREYERKTKGIVGCHDSLPPCNFLLTPNHVCSPIIHRMCYLSSPGERGTKQIKKLKIKWKGNK